MTIDDLTEGDEDRNLAKPRPTRDVQRSGSSVREVELDVVEGMQFDRGRAGSPRGNAVADNGSRKRIGS
jgi:hypothetical protein